MNFLRFYLFYSFRLYCTYSFRHSFASFCSWTVMNIHRKFSPEIDALSWKTFSFKELSLSKLHLGFPLFYFFWNIRIRQWSGSLWIIIMINMAEFLFQPAVEEEEPPSRDQLKLFSAGIKFVLNKMCILKMHIHPENIMYTAAARIMEVDNLLVTVPVS